MRHVSNLIVVSSQIGQFLFHISLESNTDRDIVTILTRDFVSEFLKSPESVKKKGEKSFYRRK